MVTPKRPRRLYDVLEPEEVGRLLEAASSTRDRLAILLLYGCGLKTSELCALRWSDVDIAGRTVQVRFAGGTREGTCPGVASARSRKILLPDNAIPLLQAESCYRQSDAPVFRGKRNHPVSIRTVERIVRRAATLTGLTKEVCCRTLRRSYAVQCLRDGMDVENLRNSLGHLHVESTLVYCRYLPPKAGEVKAVGAMRQAPLSCTAFPPALSTIQCSAP